MARTVFLSSALALALCATAAAMPLGTTKLVSHQVAPVAGNAGGNDDSYGGGILMSYDQPMSAGGRYVTFLSDAQNLQTAIPDAHVSTRLFRADLFTGATVMVDVNAAGTGHAVGSPAPNQGYPDWPTASADGRYVLWTSGAADLVANFVDGAATDDTAPDVYVRDMSTGVTSLVSRTTGSATAGGNGGSSQPVVTPDGRFVVFRSRASDLTADTDGNGATDLFIRDLQSGTTRLVSRGLSGAAAGGTGSASVTPDGRYVTYVRTGNVSDLVAGGTGTDADVYRRDMTTGTTVLVSGIGGSATNGAGSTSGVQVPQISADGRYVVFASSATTLAGTDTNFGSDVFLRDVTGGTTTMVSRNSAGTDAGNGSSSLPRITPDGRWIVYSTTASDIAPGGTGTNDVVRYDRTTGASAYASLRADGSAAAGSGDASAPMVSDDGRYVTFVSAATTLVAGFVDDNGGAGTDVFKRDMTAGTTELVSGELGSATAGANQSAGTAWMSSDGRYETFISGATSLVDPAPDGTHDQLFLRGNFLPTGLSIGTAAGAATNAFSFTGSATDPDGSIASLGWLFGDDTSGSGAGTSHTYAATGARTVTLTATDNLGESASTTTTVNPVVPPAPAGTGDTTGTPGGTGETPVFKSPATAPGLVGKTVEVDGKGRFALRLRCPAGGAACTGKVTVRTAKAVAAARKKAKKKKVLVLASKAYSVAAGKTGSVKLTLAGRARTLLKRLRRLAAVATFVPANGGKKKTAAVTLKPKG